MTLWTAQVGHVHRLHLYKCENKKMIFGILFFPVIAKSETNVIAPASSIISHDDAAFVEFAGLHTRYSETTNTTDKNMQLESTGLNRV